MPRKRKKSPDTPPTPEIPAPDYPERVHRPRTDILVGWTKEENERYALFIQAAGRECRRRYAVYSERDYGAITMEQTMRRRNLMRLWYNDKEQKGEQQ